MRLFRICFFIVSSHANLYGFLSFHSSFLTLLLFQLYHKARHHVQSAKQLFALASEQSTLKPSPLRMKKIYVLGGLEVRGSTASLTCYLTCLLALVYQLCSTPSVRLLLLVSRSRHITSPRSLQVTALVLHWTVSLLKMRVDRYEK